MDVTLRGLLTCKYRGLLYSVLKLNGLFIIPFRNTHLRIGKGCGAMGEGRLFLGVQWKSGRFMPSQMVMRAGSSITLNGETKIYSGHELWINPNASLVLGSGYINNGFRLSCFERIEIGHHVLIGENVTIRDSDNHSVDGGARTRPVHIGDHVWIGLNATILKGVSVGDGAVIAAGAVVNRDVPARALVAGVPAVVVRQDVRWE